MYLNIYHVYDMRIYNFQKKKKKNEYYVEIERNIYTIAILYVYDTSSDGW